MLQAMMQHGGQIRSQLPEQVYVHTFLLISFISSHFILTEPFNFQLMGRVCLGLLFVLAVCKKFDLFELRTILVSMYLLVLCSLEMLTSQSVPFRLIDFSVTFFCFFIIFRARCPAILLLAPLVFYCFIFVVEAFVHGLMFYSNPKFYDGYRFHGFFSINSKTMFVIFSLATFFVTSQYKTKHLVFIIATLSTLLLASQERAIIFGYIFQLVVTWLGRKCFDGKKFYLVLTLCFSSSLFLFFILKNGIDISTTTFWDHLVYRLVFYAKSLVAITEAWPRGFGKDGCQVAIPLIDVSHLFDVTREIVNYSPNQIKKLNQYSGINSSLLISTHNVFLGLICDYGLVGLCFVLLIFFSFGIAVLGALVTKHHTAMMGLIGLIGSITLCYSLTPGLNEIHWIAMLCGMFLGRASWELNGIAQKT